VPSHDLLRIKWIRGKPIILPIVLFWPFHENDGGRFCNIFQSGKPNRVGSVYAVQTAFDLPTRQQILHKHAASAFEPTYAKGGIELFLEVEEGRMAYVGSAVDDTKKVLGREPLLLKDWAQCAISFRKLFGSRTDASVPSSLGTVITLPDILKARKRRRRGLIAKLRERTKAVEQLLDIKRNDNAESVECPVAERNEKKATGPRLKRYLNDGRE
jgi:hypothetical protein